MDKFLNPRLQEAYVALENLFPNVGWQDMGEPGEMICLPITIRNNAEPTNIHHNETLWITAEGAELFGYFKSDNGWSVSFDFEK